MELTNSATGKRDKRDEPLRDEREDKIIPVYSANWIVEPVTNFERIKALCKRPDKGYQASTQVAFISLFLGLLGFAAGLLSLAIGIVELAK